MKEVEGLPERLTDQCADAGSLPALAGWQPIETAPKDGTVILACDEWGGMFVVKWTACGPKGQWDLTEVGSYATDAWPSSDPTHWMPLPPPPVQGE